MSNEQMLQAIGQMITKQLNEQLNKQLGPIHEKLDILQEDMTKVKFQVNTLYDWVDGIDLSVTKLKEIAEHSA